MNQSVFKIGRFKIRWQLSLLLLLFLAIACKKEHKSNENSTSNIHYFIGGQQDKVFSVEKTGDGGFLYGGYTTLGKNTDAFLLKCDANGKQEWYKTFGGTGYDFFRHAISTADGGFIAVGASNTVSLDTSKASYTGYAVKLDANGTMLWQKYYGNYETSFFTVSEDLSSNRFYVTGNVYFLGQGLINLVCIGSNGNSLFNRVYSTSSFANVPPLYMTSLYNMLSTSAVMTLNPAGNLLLGGMSSKSGLISEIGFSLLHMVELGKDGLGIKNFYRYNDFESGTYYWQSLFANNNYTRTPYPVKLVKLSDGYLVATCMEDPITKVMRILILKTNASADVLNPIWHKEFFGLGNAVFRDIFDNGDGTFMLTGASSSQIVNGAYSECFNGLKTMLVKMDANGKEIWTRYLGGEDNANVAMCTQPSMEDGFIMAGYNSNNQIGFNRMFFIKLDKDGKMKE